MKKLKIEIDLNSRDCFVSEYNDKTLDPELRDYVLNELVGYDTNVPVIFYVKPKFKISRKDKQSYIQIFRKEFIENLTDLEYFRKQSNKRKIILLAIGVFFLLLQFGLADYFGAFLIELINIIGCVCIWEVTYSLLFTEATRSRDIKRHKQIINADILFLE